MAQEDYLLRLSILQDEARKIEEQIEMINLQISEFDSIKIILENFSKENPEEILAPIGKGIYAKSKMLEKKLLVNVGCNVVLKKSPKETEEIVEKQIKQLANVKEILISEIEKINIQLQGIVEEAQKANP